MTVHTSIDRQVAEAISAANLTKRDPFEDVEKFADTMRGGIAFREQRIATRKRERADRIAAYQADKKTAKARYEAEIALLDQYIAEEKESSDADIKADRAMVAMAKAALAVEVE